MRPSAPTRTSDGDEQRALSERIARTAVANGFQVVEDRPARHRQHPTVLVRAGDILLGCRAQLSPISVATVRRRTTAAVDAGITPLWTTTDRRAAVVDRAPWVRIDRLPWQGYLDPDQGLPVRGGVRALVTVRCTAMTICHDKKGGRRCSGWNSHWEPRQLRRFDDLVVRAATADLKPVRQRVGRHMYWFWVPAADLASVEPPPSSGSVVPCFGALVSRAGTTGGACDDSPVHGDLGGCCRMATGPWNDDPAPAPGSAGTAKPTVLDWSDSRHLLASPQACQICGAPSMLADEDARPCHKVCAERERSPIR